MASHQQLGEPYEIPIEEYNRLKTAHDALEKQLNDANDAQNSRKPINEPHLRGQNERLERLLEAEKADNGTQRIEIKSLLDDRKSKERDIARLTAYSNGCDEECRQLKAKLDAELQKNKTQKVSVRSFRSCLVIILLPAKHAIPYSRSFKTFFSIVQQSFEDTRLLRFLAQGQVKGTDAKCGELLRELKKERAERAQEVAENLTTIKNLNAKIPQTTKELIKDNAEKDEQINALREAAAAAQEQTKGLEDDISKLQDKYDVDMKSSKDQLKVAKEQLKVVKQEKKEVMTQEMDGDDVEGSAEEEENPKPTTGGKKKRRRKKRSGANKNRIALDENPAEAGDATEEASAQAKGITEEVPAQAGDATEEALTPAEHTIEEVPAQAEDTTEEALAQYKDIKEEVPAQAEDAVEEIPTQAKDTMEEIPTQSGDITKKVPAQAGDATEEALAQVKDTTEEVPAQAEDKVDAVATQADDNMDTAAAQNTDTTDTEASEKSFDQDATPRRALRHELKYLTQSEHGLSHDGYYTSDQSTQTDIVETLVLRSIATQTEPPAAEEPAAVDAANIALPESPKRPVFEFSPISFIDIAPTMSERPAKKGTTQAPVRLYGDNMSSSGTQTDAIEASMRPNLGISAIISVETEPTAAEKPISQPSKPSTQLPQLGFTPIISVETAPLATPKRKGAMITLNWYNIIFLLFMLGWFVLFLLERHQASIGRAEMRASLAYGYRAPSLVPTRVSVWYWYYQRSGTATAPPYPSRAEI